MIKNYITILFTALCITSCAQSNKQKDMQLNLPTTPITLDSNLQVATFGNGCFWCTEAVFQQLEGVEKVTSGYSGGFVPNPTYEEVCGKKTGHAEVLQIIYNPLKISFDDLLEVFWKTHDPTTLNQQGADIGPQYRSVVFYHNQEQKEKTEKYKKLLDENKAFDRPIVTAIEGFANFYTAEDYHQNFYNNNGSSNGYCRMVIRPKVEKFEKIFKNKLKKN
jgi:peptide-methionine (S)-S-oxide reductase